MVHPVLSRAYSGTQSTGSVAQQNYFKALPNELIQEVFHNLDDMDLVSASRVDKVFYANAITMVPHIAFGKEQWEKYFGDVGEEPPLPENLGQILLSDCPFNPGKVVWQTHLLTLIPSQIRPKDSDEFRPFNLNLLGDLIQKPAAGGNKTRYGNPRAEVLDQHGETVAEESHWVLLAKDVLEDSRNKTRDEQMALCRCHAGYRTPKLLEVATSILMHFVVSDEQVFSEFPITYVCCQEQVGEKRTVVGNFTRPEGLHFHHRVWLNEQVGAAPLRKL